MNARERWEVHSIRDSRMHWLIVARHCVKNPFPDGIKKIIKRHTRDARFIIAERSGCKKMNPRQSSATKSPNNESQCVVGFRSARLQVRQPLAEGMYTEIPEAISHECQSVAESHITGV